MIRQYLYDGPEPCASEMVFTMGIPGSGKSTWAGTNLPQYKTICSDMVKRLHPSYNPRKPHLVHEWSQGITEQMFDEVVIRATGHLVIQGTGSNYDRFVRRIRMSKSAGFHVVLVYVQCSIETALTRNARRRQIIPEHIIRQKAVNIAANFPFCASFVDTVIEVDNEKEIDLRN